MKKLLTAFICFSATLLAEDLAEPLEDRAKLEQDVTKLSEALGHLIGKNISNLGVDIDIAQVVQGLKDSSAGKPSPLSESECVEAISVAQEASFKELAQKNLTSAQEFLTKNGKDKKVVSLEEGKLQYKIERTGTGSAIEKHATPIVRYTGKFLDGTVFGASKDEEVLSLDETIPGLQTGMIGMKEGEKRTLYVHPDLGYGTAGFLPPNSLLTFEVELIKVEGKLPEMNQSITASSDLEPAAHPDELSANEEEKHVR